MSGATWAIVPVKALAEAKQRLADVLPLEARRRLMLVMLHDVLAALKQVETLGPIVIVSPDQHVARIAEREGLLLLREARPTGHSAAVAAGLAFAKSHGATRTLTLPADVPLVTPDEITGVINNEAHGLTIVPSRDGDGSNAILFEPLDALTPSFGPASFARHTAQAAERGIACRILSLPGIGLDIDEPDDLAELVQRTHGLARYAFLTEPDFSSAGADR
jgi:2-phospho-L-lactate/phosphoenolpyruvate guanylyltransferase